MMLADNIKLALDGRPDTSWKPLHLLVGKSNDGQWIVRDQHGRCGGIFASRTQAFRFACDERGDRPGAIVLVPGTLELFAAPSTS